MGGGHSWKGTMKSSFHAQKSDGFFLLAEKKNHLPPQIREDLSNCGIEDVLSSSLIPFKLRTKFNAIFQVFKFKKEKEFYDPKEILKCLGNRYAD
jgi:hypothetical protein